MTTQHYNNPANIAHAEEVITSLEKHGITIEVIVNHWGLKQVILHCPKIGTRIANRASFNSFWSDADVITDIDTLSFIEDNFGLDLSNNALNNAILNKNNVIGAVVVLKHCHVMPNNTPLKVVDYNKGDGGTGYLPMIMVNDNKVFEWVRLRSVKSVLKVGQPFEDKQNIKILLKQIKHFTAS